MERLGHRTGHMIVVVYAVFVAAGVLLVTCLLIVGSLRGRADQTAVHLPPRRRAASWRAPPVRVDLIHRSRCLGDAEVRATS